MEAHSKKPMVGAVLFEGFELLDTYGPLEMFLIDPSCFDSTMLAKDVGPIKSSQGPIGVADQSLQNCSGVDILLVPGGFGVRSVIHDTAFLQEVKRLADNAKYVCSVCTGAAILAQAGLLDGRKATTNKAVWNWATSQGKNAIWIPKARWVVDGKFYTSSGVSAGMDMALGLIEQIYGKSKSLEIADEAEYDWHQDKNWDPFAQKYGLV